VIVVAVGVPGTIAATGVVTVESGSE
jgi:hypothetical protein